MTFITQGLRRLLSAQKGEPEVKNQGSQQDFWRNQLASIPSALELPFDHPRNAKIKGHWQALDIDTNALGDDTQIIAAFAAFISRHTGQSDLTFTLPAYFSGADGPIFVRLETPLDENPPFSEWSVRVKNILQTFSSYVPHKTELLFQALPDDWDNERNMLFQLQFQRLEEGSEIWSAKTALRDTLPEGKTALNADLALIVQDNRLYLNYDSGLFEANTAQRMADALKCFISGISANPGTTLQSLPLLTNAQRELILDTFSLSETSFPEWAPIHLAIEQQASSRADEIAVVFKEKTLSYGRLNGLANALAHRLREQGVGPETQVGLFMERGMESVIGALATLKAGGAYLPLDAGYPAERLSFILKDAQVPVILTQAHLHSRLPSIEAFILDVSADRSAPLSTDNPPLKNKPDDTALVLYTSGSTGNPKGVQVMHRNLDNLMHAYRRVYGFGEAWRPTVGLVAFFAFAVFQADWLRALVNGGRLVIMPQETLMSPSRLFSTMRDQGVDFAEFVPSLLRSLTEYLDSSGKRLDFIRVIVIGSDRWYMREHRTIHGYLGPETRFIHVYGASETTFDTSWFENTEADVPGEQLAPIGKPFSNIRTYVVDNLNRPQPIGVPGELIIGGAGVSKGYLNLPELTTEKFIADPFAEGEGRAYRTGDLARFLPDGNLAFLGRRDHQVKISGFRIELGEIEAILEQQPEIRTAIVQPVTPPFSGPRLVAYCIASDSSHLLTDREVRTKIGDHLPPFMIPSHFLFLEQLPLTPSGKINRNALPEVQFNEPNTSPASTDDSTSIDNEIAEEIISTWQRTLNRTHIGMDDDFFELGGDSMALVSTIAALEDDFGISVNDQDLQGEVFRTVRTLSHFVDEKLNG